MGSVSQFHDRTRPVARRIESEEEAVAAARNLAAAFALQASERDINRVLPYAELDALSQSGLTAIAVPPEYEGLDVPNALLGEIVAIIAEGDSSVAEWLEVHFRVLEQLRLEAGDELKSALFARALTGDRFAAIHFAEPRAVVPPGGSYELVGRSAPASGVLFADWIAAGITDPAGGQITLHLPSASNGLQIIDDWDGFGQRTNGAGTIIATGIAVAADATIAHSPRDHSTASVMAALLHGATDLGIARAALSHLRAVSPSAADRIGKLAVGAEAAAALVERAGHKLDFAQVSPSVRSIGDAYFSASAAKITASSIALETANALFELSDSKAASIGLNLDRHWRNARIRASGAATDDLYRQAGEHHLRAKS